MNVKELVQQSFHEARAKQIIADTDEMLHWERSRAWVEALARRLHRMYSDDELVRVFWQGNDSNRAEFNLNELLHDICICRVVYHYQQLDHLLHFIQVAEGFSDAGQTVSHRQSGSLIALLDGHVPTHLARVEEAAVGMLRQVPGHKKQITGPHRLNKISQRRRGPGQLQTQVGYLLLYLQAFLLLLLVVGGIIPVVFIAGGKCNESLCALENLLPPVAMAAKK